MYFEPAGVIGIFIVVIINLLRFAVFTLRQLFKSLLISSNNLCLIILIEAIFSRSLSGKWSNKFGIKLDKLNLVLVFDNCFCLFY